MRKRKKDRMVEEMHENRQLVAIIHEGPRPSK